MANYALEPVVAKMLLTKPLREALAPFVALLQPHNDVGDDSRPVFGVNDACITLGDLRRAKRVLEAL